MGGDHRLVSTISPEIENKLSTNEDYDCIHSTLSDAIDLFKKLKHSTLLVIPSDLIPYFYSNMKLKVLYQRLINDTQSNSVFRKIENKGLCNNKDLNEIIDNFANAQSTKKCIVSYLYNSKIPVLIGLTDHEILKKVCTDCNNTYLCSGSYTIPSGTVPKYEDFARLAVPAITQTVELFRMKKGEISEIDCKALMVLMCLVYGVEEEKIKHIRNINISKHFISDVQGIPNVDICSIVFSIFRAFSYPSSQDPSSRHKLSIDWHKNDPAKASGYTLYRVDVVGPEMTGLAGSGKKRALMACSKGKAFFMYYTEHHDFVDKTITSRMVDL